MARIGSGKQLIAGLADTARQKSISMAQLAAAWVISRGKEIIPLFGARRRQQLTEALQAMSVSFTGEELAAIERLAPPGAAAGERYAPQQMTALDSERAVSGR